MERQTQHRIGRFAIEGEIARGGMGVVYRARDEATHGLVALKVLPDLNSLDPDAVVRFRREAESLNRLSHPGIVPVIEAGEDAGVCYYAMPLIDGPSLEELLSSLRARRPEQLLGTLAEETSLDQVCPTLATPASNDTTMPGIRYARSCAEFAIEIADALAVAHAGQVIHRDVKPSNVIINRSGRPVLVDFGLARDELDDGLTRSGEALGTPAYMAPEQASGSRDMDARVDVYGLGASLYELLTLRPPFSGATALDIMRNIVETEATPLRELNPRVPVALENIVNQCLAKDPDRRYATIAGVSQDLKAFLAGRTIAARSPNVVRRVGAKMARYRSPMSLALIVLFACGLGILLTGAVTTRLERRDGREALDDARALLATGKIAAAQEAYGRAAVLLGDATAREARRAHLREMFERLYSNQRYEELAAFLAGFPTEERDEVWRRWQLRLGGRGELRVPARGGVSVSIRAIHPDTGRLGPWQPGSSVRELPVGDYLVRVERSGLATVVRAVRIERDQRIDLDGPNVLASRLPASMVPVHIAAGTVLVSVAEVDCGSYATRLRELRDPGVRDDLLPQHWQSSYSPDPLTHPVRGLSFRQARTMAALLGGHLLTPSEFQAAALAELPGLAYPWGAQFDPDRVVADPSRSDPVSIETLEAGASPHGIRHLLGNVAELLSSPAGGPVLLAGGHFASEPEELEVRMPATLPDASTQSEYAGFRIARFLPPPPGSGARDAVQRAVASAAEVCDWTVGSGGSIRTVWNLRDAPPQLRIATDGFVPLRWAAFHHDDEIAVDVRRERFDGARLRVEPTTPLRLEAELIAERGLTCRRDRYELALPVAAVLGGDRLVRLRLPVGCNVEHAFPEPDYRYADEEMPVLVWELRTRVPIVVVRFRRDGLLTESLPVHAAVVAALNGFLSARATRNTAVLKRLLAAEFEQLPQGYTRADAASLGNSRVGRDRFEQIRILDVTAVGDVVTCEFDATWHVVGRDGVEVSIPDWRMRCQLRRRGPRYEVLGLAPAGRPDEGVLDADGYRHARLKLRLTPPEGVAVTREDRCQVPQQLSCRPEDTSAVRVEVLGWRGEDRGDVLHRLSGGDFAGRPGRLLRRPNQVLFGARPARAIDWVFGRPGGGEFARERWLILRRGRRQVLVREIAEARTIEAAESLFRQSRGFFDSVLDGVEVR